MKFNHPITLFILHTRKQTKMKQHKKRAHAAILDFLEFGWPEISKMKPGDTKSENIFRHGQKLPQGRQK